MRGGAVLRLLWQLLWNVVALFRTSQPSPLTSFFLTKLTSNSFKLQCKKTKHRLPFITSRKCGGETRRVWSHCSWPRLYISLWLDLGGSGEVTFIANNKSAVFFYTKTQIKNSSHHISLSRWGNRSGQIRISSAALKTTLAAENVFHSEETRVSRQSVDKLHFTGGALHCTSHSIVFQVKDCSLCTLHFALCRGRLRPGNVTVSWLDWSSLGVLQSSFLSSHPHWKKDVITVLS